MLAGLSPNLRGAVMALLAFALFSLHDVFVKLLGAVYSPLQIVFFSVLFSFPLFTLMLVSSGADSQLRPRAPWWTLARTVAVIITGLAAFSAFSLLPLAQTYAILFSTPILITLLSIPILGERVGWHRGGAILLGLVGVMVVLKPGAAVLSLGHLMALIAACGGATAAVIVRRIGTRERSAVLLLYPLLGNLTVAGAGLPSVYVAMPLADIATVAGIAALSLAATALMISAYRTGEAATVAPMQYSQILWATLYGWLVFAEAPESTTLVGAAIVIASGLYIVVREAAGRSANMPVLRTRTRTETGTYPRVGPLLDAREEAERTAPPRKG